MVKVKQYDFTSTHKTPVILSLGAGVQSTALALMAANIKMIRKYCEVK